MPCGGRDFYAHSLYAHVVPATGGHLPLYDPSHPVNPGSRQDAMFDRNKFTINNDKPVFKDASLWSHWEKGPSSKARPFTEFERVEKWNDVAGLAERWVVALSVAAAATTAMAVIVAGIALAFAATAAAATSVAVAVLAVMATATAAAAAAAAA